MLLPKKPPDSTMSPEIHSEDAQMMAKLPSKLLKEDTEDIKLKTRKKPEKKSYMLEFPLRSKNKISKDKLRSLETDILTIQSSKISEAELITSEKDLKPFWNSFCQTMSTRLLSMQKTDFPDSAFNLSKIYAPTTIQNSQLYQILKSKKQTKKNLQKTSFQSLQFLQQDSTEKENIKVAKMIKFKPNRELKLYLNKCFGAHRYFYNKCVYTINNKYNSQLEFYKNRYKNKECCCMTDTQKGTYCTELISDNPTPAEVRYFCDKHKSRKLKFSYYDLSELRTLLIPKEKNITKDIEWQKKIPYDLKQNAIRLCLANLKSAISNKKSNNNSFKLGYISKKNKVNEIFKLPSNFIIFKKCTMLSKYNKENKFTLSRKTREWLENNNYKLNDTITITRKINSFYICASYDTTEIKTEKPYKVVSIDPGDRSFATLYSPEGLMGYLGNNLVDGNTKIRKSVNKIDKLRKHISNGGITDNQGVFHKLDISRRRNMRKGIRKCYKKIKGQVNNIHNQIINFLCINFETIILGKYNTSKKVKKEGRKLDNEKTRKMLILSHYRFEEKLKRICKRIKTNLIMVSEEYTSKTYGKCGKENKKLGKSKTFICGDGDCRYKIDRDVNGARNILIKTVEKYMNKAE